MTPRKCKFFKNHEPLLLFQVLKDKNCVIRPISGLQILFIWLSKSIAELWVYFPSISIQNKYLFLSMVLVEGWGKYILLRSLLLLTPISKQLMKFLQIGTAHRRVNHKWRGNGFRSFMGERVSSCFHHVIWEDSYSLPGDMSVYKLCLMSQTNKIHFKLHIRHPDLWWAFLCLEDTWTACIMSWDLHNDAANSGCIIFSFLQVKKKKRNFRMNELFQVTPSVNSFIGLWG